MDHIWEEGGDSIWWNTSEEKLLHPHHINIIWARKPGPGLEAKIATYMSYASSSLSHHRMNIEQFHVEFCSEQNHWDVFVFHPVTSKLSPRHRWLPPAGPLTQKSVRFSVTGTNSNNVRMSRVFVSHTLTDTEHSGNNVKTFSTWHSSISPRSFCKCSLCPHCFMTMYWLYSDMSSHKCECVSHDQEPGPAAGCCLWVHYSLPEPGVWGELSSLHILMISFSVAH